jgi:hypothetical protein
MADHLAAALYFEECAGREHRSEERARLLTLAREFRWLAMAEAKRFIREIPKRPRAPSVKKLAPTRKRA